MSSDKPPSLLSIQQPASNSSSSSPRGIGAASLLNGSSGSKVKTPTGSNTPTSLPQVLPNPQYTSSHSQASGSQYPYGSDNSSYMNSQGTPSYGGMEYHHHMSQGQPPTPQTATSGSSMSFPTQPPVLQPAYSQPHHGFPQFPSFSSPNGVSSPAGQPGVSGPMSMHPSTQLLPLPQSSGLAPSASSLSVSAGGPQGQASSGTGAFSNHQFDTTGQIAPPGMKPRVAATLWEDEGSLCFQVEARGVCVARREDNHMINGTKLLNVAGMTRGRRDGILKSEKVRHVVKIGPMHLKGVWIPFERALDFANKEKITELLYPLFVHNIGAFLYHPTNQHRTNAVMAAADRRRADSQVVQQSQALQQIPHMQQGRPSVPPLHHGSMHTPLHASLPPHQGLGTQPRPGMERSLSFPTPPSSASSVMGVNGPDGSSFWNQGMNVPGSGNQALAIDTVINSRSMPTTPATTPPGGPMQQLQQPQYPPPSSIYPPGSSSMSQQNIVQQNVQRFGQSLPQPGQYMSQGRDSNNMGPPPTSRGPASSRPSSRQGDGNVKDDADEQNGLVGESEGHVSDIHGESQPDHEGEHEEEYTTHGGNYSNGHRSGGSYYPPLNNDPAPHLSPEMNGSPGQNGQAPSTPARTSYSTSSGAMPRPVDGSGATPRTTTTPQQQWSHGGPGYSTPPRSSSTSGNAVHPPPSRDLFLGSEHSEANGNASADSSYTAQSGLGVSLPPQGPSESFSRMNGSSTPSSNKRIREMDDDEEHGSRPSSRGHDERLPEAEGVLKRRKTIREGSTPSVALTGGSAFDRNNEGRLNRTRSAIAPNRARNR